MIGAKTEHPNPTRSRSQCDSPNCWYHGATPNADRLHSLLRVLAREDRLRALGFEDPTNDERRERLARNMALKDWPE